MGKFKAVESSSLSTFYKKRYVIVDEDTGEILDDAQGYGYKSPQKAHAAFAYKNRDKSRDKEKAAKKKRIQAWMKEHRDFVQDMDAIVFEMAKGSWDPNDKIDAALVRKMLKEHNLDPDFSAGELLRVWKIS